MGESKPRRPRTPSAGTTRRAARPKEGEQPAGEGIAGMLASEVETGTVEWLWYPFIPRGMLSLVVGNPCVGKSTFIAALIAHATGAASLEQAVKKKTGRVVFLPGQEEDLAILTIPRLRSANAIFREVMIPKRQGICLVRDKDRLARMVQDFRASLLIGDPIDSYVDEGLHEDRSQDVRTLLEAAAWIAKKTKAAVVFARHPGKDPGNVMPGSRQWRAVPRSVVQLTTDGGVPPRYILSHYKDSLGTQSTPLHYTFTVDGGAPPRFCIGETVDKTAEDLARSAAGPTGRYKLMAACRLIRWLFEVEDEPTRPQLGDEARRQGLGEDTVNDALRLLSVKSVNPSERGLPWKLHRTQSEWPMWLLATPLE